MAHQFLFSLALLFALNAVVLSAEKQPPVPTRVDDFQLQDFRGKRVALTDFKKQSYVVVAFLGVECPLAKLYTVRLNKLAEEYAERGVGFVAINSNSQDSITELAVYAKQHSLRLPLLKDAANRVADQFAAERTPEVFLLGAVDAQGGRPIEYRGRIDDQYLVGGKSRAEPTREDLREAINDALAGKPIRVAFTEPIGCHIGRIKQPRADAKVTYSNQIARLLQKRCVECHRDGEIAPFALTDYDEVVGWAEMIREVVEEQRMPPWHADPKHGQFANDRHLSREEKKLLFDWIDAGAPHGKLADLPAPQEYTTGWQLPNLPELVVYMRDNSFAVAAEGAVKYQYFRVDPGFTEDKWVSMAEILPGNRAVVHHVLVFVRPPGVRAFRNSEDSKFLAAYVPGKRARVFPPGMAKRVPAGSELIFQVHYTPIGSPQQDHSKLGLVFANEKDVTHQVITTNATSRRLAIPPGASDHEVTARSPKAPRDVQLLAMMPHMHLRGKSFRYVAEFPDGREQIMLDVPAYDFNWQTAYQLAEPLKLPAGTQMFCRATFDNSKGNAFNPDPTRTVRWGDQTWDEMMIGYFDIAIARDPGDEAKNFDAIDRRAGEILAEYDKDRDGQVQRREVPLNLTFIFNRIDSDDDQVVTKQELRAAIASGGLK